MLVPPTVEVEAPAWWPLAAAAAVVIVVLVLSSVEAPAWWPMVAATVVATTVAAAHTPAVGTTTRTATGAAPGAAG